MLESNRAGKLHLPAPTRYGVVAAIQRHEQWLVIRRAAGISAAGKYCFPGGGIEPGEMEEMALKRELREELGVEITPLRHVWRSCTAWGVALSWWRAELAADAELVANPLEVAAIHWLTLEEILALEELLPSNREFFAALKRGEIAW